MGERDYELSENLLIAYHDSALGNAKSLLEESYILLSNGKYARAYFLAVAAMEETGKAYHAFATRGRNLDNSAVQKKMKGIFENHPQKIFGAFLGLFHFLPLLEKAKYAETMFDRAFNLIDGREASMYVDARIDNSIIDPLLLIRHIDAQEVYALATNCHKHMVVFVRETQPVKTGAIEDKFLLIPLTKMMDKAKDDFSAFLLDSMRSDLEHFDFAVVAVRYHDAYYTKNKKYVSPDE